ncbi:ISL3 family transposase [Rhodanobacter sp. 115]|uniref:ISL3 family transposase n=1 Tax=Rhodanobacter sp. FW021-MT20 TaxID=1162282 RepID=UPI0034E48DF3
METLFTQALGLAAPWRVAHVDFQQAAGRIVFTVECTAKRLACPACGAADQPIHDRLPRRWQHLNFFQYRALIEAKVPRIGCRECEKTNQVDVPWARAGAGFTETLEAFVIALCTQMPVSAVAALLGVSDDRIWRVLDFHVEAARAREDFSDVRRVSADERSARKGQRFLTLFCDLAARRLLFAVQGRKADTFKAFAGDLAAHGGDAAAITDVSLDLGAAYQAGTREYCPNAKISFDPFHVVALANEALDQVRRAEVKQVDGLKGIRWGTLKDAANWTRKQIDQMHWLQRSNLQTARAWRLKQALRAVFAKGGHLAQATILLDGWIHWARRCRLTPFKRLAATIRKHREGILEHFRSGLSNGFAEGINGRIQAAKARARGYGTDRHLIVMSYLICANLKHLPKNPWTHAAQQVVG